MNLTPPPHPVKLWPLNSPVIIASDEITNLKMFSIGLTTCNSTPTRLISKLFKCKSKL